MSRISSRHTFVVEGAARPTPGRRRTLVNHAQLAERHHDRRDHCEGPWWSKGGRWEIDPTLNFPKPIKIKRRKYWYEDELDEFDAVQG
jgi:hypothetical protein